MPDPTVAPKPFHELVSEVLREPIPYKAQAQIPLNESFYLVCDYPFVSKGTVLFCLRPGESRVQVHGFLPQATPAEKLALETLLMRNTGGKSLLNMCDIERSQLHACNEEQGVARLLEVQRLMEESNKLPSGLRFH